jgi:chloramphenicol 3-O-phosphotransferase
VRKVGRTAAVPGEVLIVTGPSAAGKTTVTQRLAEESAEPSVHLHTDDFFKALKAGRLRGWMAGAEPQHEVVFEAIGSAAGAYAAGGYFVVVDTLVRRRYLDTLVDTILLRNVSVDLVVLRPSFADVLARCRLRDPRDRHEDDILRRLYGYFDEFDDLEAHIIDNSDHNPDQTIEAIRTMVHSGVARISSSRSLRPLSTGDLTSGFHYGTSE